MRCECLIAITGYLRSVAAVGRVLNVQEGLWSIEHFRAITSITTGYYY